MLQIENLRRLTVKLNMDGTISDISKPFTLYKNSYGFVLIQCYIQKTQNSTNSPFCSVYKSVVDVQGNRKVGANYPLLYVGEASLDGYVYRVFECPMPKEFTEDEGDLAIVFNYGDMEIDPEDPEGKQLKLKNQLTSGQFVTKVHPGGWNNEDVVLDISSYVVAVVSQNEADIQDVKNDINELKLGMSVLSMPIDNSEADQVSTPDNPARLEIQNGRIKAIAIKGDPGDGGADLTPIPEEYINNLFN